MYPDRWRALFIGWKKEPTESEEGNGQRPGSKNEKTDDRDPRLPSGRTPLPQDPEQRANHNNSGNNDKDGKQFGRHVSSILSQSVHRAPCQKRSGAFSKQHSRTAFEWAPLFGEGQQVGDNSSCDKSPSGTVLIAFSPKPVCHPPHGRKSFRQGPP